MKSREWYSRRWWEFRIGYTTYLSFIFNFSNFILILYGLTNWFKDIPFPIFAILVFSAILPLATLVGHKHNLTQLRTEQSRMNELHPYKNKVLPDSKELMQTIFILTVIDWMLHTTKDKELEEKLIKMRHVFEKFLKGDEATEAMKSEGL